MGSVKSNMKNMKIKKVFATGRCPDALQRADNAGRLQGETKVSHQAPKNISARPEAISKVGDNNNGLKRYPFTRSVTFGANITF